MGINSNPETRRAYQREWIKKRRETFFADKICVKCGSKNDLELDHIDRKNKIANSIWSWTESRRLEEIAKCQILCYECHLEKTKKENSESQSGIPNACRKLSADQVAEIIRLMRSRVPQRKIAPMFNISRSVISHISMGIIYKELLPDGEFGITPDSESGVRGS